MQMHICVADLSRFFQHFDFIEHFFTALCAADGFFTVEGFQLGDDGLLMADLLLLVDISAPGWLPAAVPSFPRRRSNCPENSHGPSVVQLDDFCDHAVQEIPVVGDDENGAFVVDQVVFQPCDGIHVQMVGRLVEQQKIRGGEQQSVRARRVSSDRRIRSRFSSEIHLL